MVLGPVKPHVASAANMLAAKFGIKTMYGWRPVDQFPDHPSGLAVDFMISNLSNGKAVGDALAAYVVANYKALGVKYVIWYRQVWNAERLSDGWHKYTSTSNPHTDHVHVTWYATPGSGNLVDPGGGTQTVGLPGVDQVQALFNLFKDINQTISFMTDPQNAVRAGLFIAGAILIAIGIFRWENVSGAVQSGVSTVGKAVKNASR